MSCLGLDCENKGRFYFGGKCFFMTKTTASSFSDAKDACTQQGSQLASITSAELYNVSCVPIIKLEFEVKSSFIRFTT